MNDVLFIRFLFAGLVGEAAFGAVLVTTRLFFSKAYSRMRYYALVLAMIFMLVPVSFDFQKEDIGKDKSGIISDGVLPQASLTVREADGEGLESGSVTEGKWDTFIGGVVKAARYTSLPWAIISFLLLFIRLTSSFVFCRRLKKSGTDAAIDLSRFGISGISVKKSPLTASPIVVYTAKPYIFLPCTDMTEDELESVFAHEITHIKRKDIIVRYIMLLTRCIHFYNPLVYLMCREIERECEISCDYTAAGHLSETEKRKYVSGVLSLAGKAVGKTSLSFGIASTKKELERRFNVILKNGSMSKRKKAVIYGACVCVLLCALLTGGVMAGKAVESAKLQKQETALDDVTYEAPDGEPRLVAVSINTPSSTVTYDEQAQETASDDVTYKASDSEPRLVAVTIGAPFESPEISYGYSEQHKAVDYKAASGTEVHAGIDGVVEDSGYNASDGNYVVISGANNNVRLRYNHLESIGAVSGESTKKGDVIGTVGNTGKSTGPHLHFEVSINGKNVNPEYLWD